MIWILLVLLVLPPGLSAQTRRRTQPAKPPAAAAPAPPETPQVWPIESLAVEGNGNYEESAILSASGLARGQAASRELFEAARDRLVATGLFETVGYRYEPSASGKGYHAVLHVTEVEPIYPLRFENLPVPGAELEASLVRADPLLRMRLPPTGRVLKRCTQILDEHLGKSGFSEHVTARVASEQPGEIAIVFSPSTPLPAIAFVKFVGSDAVPATTLQNAMSGVAVGVPFTEQHVRRLLDSAIRPLYEAKGRLRVAFSEISTVPATDVKGVVVTVRVTDGEVYNLGEVKADSYPLPAAEVVKAAALKSGEMADFDAVGEGRERILKLLRKNGFMKGAAKVERTLDDEGKKVDVLFKVESGPRFHFGNLKVEGLDILTEPAVRKLWGLKPGQPFDADYPDYFLNRLREDGIFDNLGRTRSSVKVNDSDHSVEVTLYFGDAARKSLLPGV